MTQFPGSSLAQQNNPKLVVVALIVALVAAVLVYVYIAMVRQQATAGQFTIYRLERPVRPGDKLDDKDVKAFNIPKDFKDAFKDAVDAKGLEARIGSQFYRGARANAVLTTDLFIDPDEDQLDRRITKGKRLIALSVNQKTLPGSLHPGMYVDIEATFPSSDGLPNVLPVIELVQVMSVGERTLIDEESASPSRSSRRSRYASISIEVTPEEATQMSKIQKIIIGDFDLHVRKPGDSGRPKIPSEQINPRVIRLITPTRLRNP